MSQTRIQSLVANGPRLKCQSCRKKRRNKNASGHCAWGVAVTSHLLCSHSVDRPLGRETKRKTSHNQTCRKVAITQFSSTWTGEGKAQHGSTLCHELVPARKQSFSAQRQAALDSHNGKTELVQPCVNGPKHPSHITILAAEPQRCRNLSACRQQHRLLMRRESAD